MISGDSDRPLPLEVRHDIPDVRSEIIDLDFDHNPLLMLPGTGLVHERMEHANIFSGGFVGGNRSVKPVSGYLPELYVSGESRDEVDAVAAEPVAVVGILGRPLSGISSGGAFPSGCVSPSVPSVDL